MLQQIATILTAALITGGASHLMAEMPAVEANIPFDFTVGKQTFKAGTYRLHTDMPSVIRLRGVSTERASIALTNQVVRHNRERQKASLIFNRYGDRYYLSQVWRGGNSQGRELIKSAAEREQMARMPSPAQVEIASVTK